MNLRCNCKVSGDPVAFMPDASLQITELFRACTHGTSGWKAIQEVAPDHTEASLAACVASLVKVLMDGQDQYGPDWTPHHATFLFRGPEILTSPGGPFIGVLVNSATDIRMCWDPCEERLGYFHRSVPVFVWACSALNDLEETGDITVQVINLN